LFVVIGVIVAALVAVFLYCIFRPKKSSLLHTRPHLTIAGPVKMCDGLGRHAVELIDALHQDIPLNFCSTRRKMCLQDVPQHIKPVLTFRGKNKGKVLLYYDSLTTEGHGKIPSFLRELGKKIPDQVRIAYSMVESTRIPALWTQLLNEYFDIVAVPDISMVEIYEKSGVTIPIFLLPLGLDLSAFLKQPLKVTQHRPFCFINASSMIARKNHEGLIKAFYQAFGKDPEVKLVMNYRYAIGDALKHVKDLIASLNTENIVLTSEALDQQAYLQFLLQGDVFVSLSKGEGFSIQPREAMALGCPVIISDNTAHGTIVKSALAHGVACPVTEPAYNDILRYTCGEEYVPDLQEAARALKEVYTYYDLLLEEAPKRRNWAATYHYDNLKNLYLNFLRPRTITLGPNNTVTETTLTTSSLELYYKYIRILGHREQQEEVNVALVQTATH